MLWGKFHFIHNIRFQILQFNFELKFYLKEQIKAPIKINFLAGSTGFVLFHEGSPLQNNAGVQRLRFLISNFKVAEKDLPIL